MKETSGRISLPVFKAISGALLGLSILTAAVRTVIRVRLYRRLHPDDFMLLFACVTLIAANVVVYLMLSDLYWSEELLLNPGPTILAMARTPEEISGRIQSTRKTMLSFMALSWTAIYAIKLCFLLFFHQMIDWLKRLGLIWKITLGITVLSYCICLSSLFMTCTHYDIEVVECAGAAGFVKTFTFAALTNSVDVMTDLLIIMVPVLLLWKAKIEVRQKTLLGCFLCLSICMIIVALVRISGLRTHKVFMDIQWLVFWNEVEASVATIMVSVTAFRQLLGIKALKAREKKNRSWYSYRRRLLYGKCKQNSDNGWDAGQLPSIPGARLTGLRTLIHGGQDLKSMTLMTGEDHSTNVGHNELGGENQKIQITQEISIESEAV